jgi:hypothetical protein
MMKTRSKRSSMNNTVKNHHGVFVEATMHGLNHWYDAMFEKLGWMLLARKNGMMDKVMSYKASVERLQKSIEYKLKHVKEADRKADLKIMWDNVCVLKEHVYEDFKE